MATGIVLAGGSSSRFGSDKASALLNGRPLLAHVVAAVAAVCDEVVVVCRRAQPLPALAPAVPLRLAFDEVEGLGPLAGLVAGLEAAGDEHCFVASCDVPLLRAGVVALLLARLPGHAAVVPLVGGREQLLVAAYDPAVALQPLRASLQAGVRRVREAVRTVHPLLVGEADLLLVDPDLASFANVNDPAGLAALSARRTDG